MPTDPDDQPEATMDGSTVRDFRCVIIAVSVGNVIEWYDFHIFGSLAAVLSAKFFEQSPGRSSAKHHCAVHRRIPDPSTWGVPFRMDE
jgi:hypothetical protein